MIDKIKGLAEVEKQCMDAVSACRAVVSVIEPALCDVIIPWSGAEMDLVTFQPLRTNFQSSGQFDSSLQRHTDDI